MRRLRGAGAAGALVAGIAQLWAVVGERGGLFVADSANQFYEAQARAWLRGRWDVAPEVLGPEAIDSGGRAFGYFGPFPALLRLPLVLVTDRLDARLGALSMLAAAAVSLLAAWFLYMEIRAIVRPGAEASGFEAALMAIWTASVGAGSTLLFLAAQPFMYHEAIAWGVALTTAVLAMLVRAARTGRLSAAALFALLAAAVLTRLATAAGGLLLAAVLGVALLTPGLPERGRRAGAAMLAAGVFSVASYATVNYVKFGSPSYIPFERHAGIMAAPARLERYERDGLFGLRYVPTNFLQYVRPDALGYLDVLPWVSFPNRQPTVIGDVEFDSFEKASSLTASMPLLSVLAVVGLVGGAARKKSEGVVAIGVLVVAAGFGVTLASAGNTHRYLGDALPALVMASALGVNAVARWSPSRRAAALAAAVGLALVSVVVIASLGVLTQRSTSPTFSRQQRDVRARIGGRFPVRRVPADGTVPTLRAGQFAVVGDCDVLYLFNGIWTLPVDRGPGGGELRLTLEVAPAPPGTREPVVSAGTRGAADFLVLEHLPGGELRFGYDHWAHPFVTGPAFRPGPAGSVTVDVVFDRTLSVVSVSRGGDSLLQLRPVMFPPAGHPLVFGRNTVGANMRPSFGGRILAPPRAPASGCSTFLRELGE